MKKRFLLLIIALLYFNTKNIHAIVYPVRIQAEDLPYQFQLGTYHGVNKEYEDNDDIKYFIGTDSYEYFCLDKGKKVSSGAIYQYDHSIWGKDEACAITGAIKAG